MATERGSTRNVQRHWVRKVLQHTVEATCHTVIISCWVEGAGAVLKGWHVFPLPLENLTAVPFKALESLPRSPQAANIGGDIRAGPCSLQGSHASVAAADGSDSQAAFYRWVHFDNFELTTSNFFLRTPTNPHILWSSMVLSPLALPVFLAFCMHARSFLSLNDHVCTLPAFPPFSPSSLSPLSLHACACTPAGVLCPAHVEQWTSLLVMLSECVR